MHIYIHIPFCDSKCGYCAFFSQVDKLNLIPDYFLALKKDLKYQLEKYNCKNISSIFIGGGTPNIADSKYYIDIFNILEPLFDTDCEITLESNPNILSQKWLLDLKNMGLNRISMGVQSFFDDKLQLLERNHNINDIHKAFNIATKHIKNVNIDLIYDSALDTEKRLRYEIESAINFGVNHISAYSLSIDKNSSFAMQDSNHKLSKTNFSEIVRDILKQNNFNQYEVSNYTKNTPCKHNLSYWESSEYLGIGASAVGRIKNIRYTGIKNIESYIKNPLKKEVEVLKKQDLEFEEIFLGLRSIIGVRKEICNKTRLKILLNENICYEKSNRIYAKDYFLADSLALYIA